MSAEQTRKGRGCFFYGCLTAIILVIVIGVGGCLTVRHLVNKLALQITETAPMQLPTVSVSPEDFSNLKARIKSFTTALEEGKEIEPLVLTEKELNSLIAGEPDLQKFSGKVYVALEGDQIKGQVSIPLEMLQLQRMLLPSLKGRYLNGTATLKASLQDGVLIVTLQSLKAKGVDIPEPAMRNLSAQNLAQDLYKDAKTSAALRRLESLEVKDGRILIKPKSGR